MYTALHILPGEEDEVRQPQYGSVGPVGPMPVDYAPPQRGLFRGSKLTLRAGVLCFVMWSGYVLRLGWQKRTWAAPTTMEAMETTVLLTTASRRLGLRRLETINHTVTVDGLKCFNTTQAIVFHPLEGRHPLVVFSPGDFEHRPGWSVQTRNSKLLEGLAASGFVVVSPLAVGGWCREAPDDQRRLAAIARAWTPVDATKGLGILGMSMGGKATLVNAAIHNASAAVSIAPYWDDGRRDFFGAPLDLLARVKVPSFIIAGTLDAKCPPSVAYHLYNSIRSQPRLAAIAELDGYAHDDLSFSPSAPYLSAVFFSCVLRTSPRACDLFSAEHHHMADFAIEPGDYQTSARFDRILPPLSSSSSSSSS